MSLTGFGFWSRRDAIQGRMAVSNSFANVTVRYASKIGHVTAGIEREMIGR